MKRTWRLPGGYKLVHPKADSFDIARLIGEAPYYECRPGGTYITVRIPERNPS